LFPSDLTDNSFERRTQAFESIPPQNGLPADPSVPNAERAGRDGSTWHHPNHVPKESSPGGIKLSRHEDEDSAMEESQPYRAWNVFPNQRPINSLYHFIDSVSWELKKQGITTTRRDIHHTKRKRPAFAWIDRKWALVEEQFASFILRTQ
jgi:hypothetical protein